MAQSTSSLPTHSPADSSPSQSSHLQGVQHGAEISVETLIAYLVASKQSLSSIHLVHDATNVLSAARNNIESTTALIAKTQYLRRSLDAQLKILRGIQFEIEGAAQSIKTEIQSVFNELDDVHTKLEGHIETLQATKIEDGFKSTEQHQLEIQAHGIVKDNLHDFIDSKPVEELRANVQTAIDSVRSAGSRIDQSIRVLEDDLQSVNEALSEQTVTPSTRSELFLNISKVLHALENHAQEMAVSLESLVKHFDLCVTAIKHTEGAGAVVAKTVNVEDLPDGGVDVFAAPAQPLTDEERSEMLQVLENDANEVQEVVLELHERRDEMIVQHEKLQAWREAKEVAYDQIVSAFKTLERTSARLSGHVAENARLSQQWAEEKIKIEDGIAGMEELCEIYKNFLHAYDGLIVETARRRTMKKQMEKLANEAQVRLEQLYEEDLMLREVFRTEQGDFLPSDIWTGLSSLPPRFAFQRIDDGDDSIPELPRKKVEEALRRLKKSERSA